MVKLLKSPLIASGSFICVSWMRPPGLITYPLSPSSTVTVRWRKFSSEALAISAASCGVRLLLRASERNCAGKRVVGRLQVLQFGLQIGKCDVGGELAGEEISRQQPHRNQQKNGDDADEDVGDDQPVAQTPHQLPPDPAEPHQQQEKSQTETTGIGPSR